MWLKYLGQKLFNYQVKSPENLPFLTPENNTHNIFSLKIYPNIVLTPLALSYRWSSLEKIS